MNSDSEDSIEEANDKYDKVVELTNKKQEGII